ncbi:hypothetical protein SDC9_104216 [bioreactor metagenome]|uniref:Uncharacterized protein n=1 Tax=bioreactor metagenome TaxID=1076179 RepID=A0A645B6Q5_9ZZZZ
MKKNCAPNDTQFNIKNVNIVNYNNISSKTFSWFHSNKYEIAKSNYGMEYDTLDYENDWLNWYLDEEGLPYPPTNKWDYLKSTSKVIKYTKIDLKEASQELMNIDIYNDNNIIAFFNKYGPLGLMPYYSNMSLYYCAEELNSFFDNPIIDLMDRTNAKPYFDGNFDYTNYWPVAFGLGNIYKFDYWDDSEGLKLIHDFNKFENKEIYLNYCEPLWIVKKVIKDYQLYCRVLTKNNDAFKVYYEANIAVDSKGYKQERSASFNSFNHVIRNTIKINPEVVNLFEIKFYIPANSLFHAILAYTIFNYDNTPLEKCKNPTCLNLFWKEHNRSEYCSSACKSTVGGRNQRDALAERAKKYILHKYRNSNLTTSEIYEIEKSEILKEFEGKKSVLEVFNIKRINEWLGRK